MLQYVDVCGFAIFCVVRYTFSIMVFVEYSSRDVNGLLLLEYADGKKKYVN